MSKVTFDNSQSSFFKTLKGKVDKYFADHQIDPTGNSKLYLKSVLQIISAMGVYIVLVFFYPRSCCSSYSVWLAWFEYGGNWI
jgi:linoleoyl-CoA desaturase